MRKIQPRFTDRRFFRRTAAQSRKINIEPRMYRGGIRM